MVALVVGNVNTPSCNMMLSGNKFGKVTMASTTAHIPPAEPLPCPIKTQLSTLHQQATPGKLAGRGPLAHVHAAQVLLPRFLTVHEHTNKT